MSRDWHVQESEEIGSVVTRVTSNDGDGDHIFYRIDKPSVGDDGSQLFEIDQDGIVRIAKSLEGLVSATCIIGMGEVRALTAFVC